MQAYSTSASRGDERKGYKFLKIYIDMKAIIYSTKSVEKDLLIKANKEKHDLSFVSATLNTDTSCYAKEKDAVIVFTSDDVTLYRESNDCHPQPLEQNNRKRQN